MLRIDRKKIAMPIDGMTSHAPSRSAKFVEARTPRMRRTGARRREELRLHGAATLNASATLVASTKLPFQRKFEIAELQFRWQPFEGRRPLGQTYWSASKKCSAESSAAHRVALPLPAPMYQAFR